ncbi:MAG: ABC transporter ATP-binding protein [Candidatus Gracilibacteria bacterium]|jgi:putative ABC transport system ATP-binding protein|nr:ABC transporter ATP-binding protein [Candidatus Gracilibacteria bacterium]
MSLIELKNIGKTYNSSIVKTVALKAVSLKIDEGEFLSIIGPSGSGKSTLMHILGFLDAPTKGIYKFEDTKIENFDEVSLAEIRNKKIGFVFQSFYLLAGLTAIENVKLPMIYAGVPEKIQNQVSRKNLEMVGLAHRMEHKPGQMSGGEQQRVAIARALSNNPKIILADEPTGNLDSKSSDEIIKILKTLHEAGTTVIIVTHNKSIAKLTNRIIEIKDGEIIKDKKSA